MESCMDRFIDKGDPESHRLFRIRKTLLEMLDDRGFEVSDADLNMSLEDFRQRFGNSPSREKLHFSTTKRQNPLHKVIIFFARKDDKGKLGISDIRQYFMRMQSESARHAIFILPGKITAQAKKAIKEIASSFEVETFEDSDLFINITKHALVPKHEILTEEEKNALLKKYMAKEHQLPRMLESDPLAKYYGLKRGKVMKLTYSGEVTGHSETYRCVW